MIAAVADIHAYGNKLELMLSRLGSEVDFETDTIVFLGDYVDGGPDAKNVVQTLIGLSKAFPHWVFLKGNHEDLMLDALVGNSSRYGSPYLWWNQGGLETAQSYLQQAMPQSYFPKYDLLEYIPYSHIRWMQKLPLFYETPYFAFVHGGFRDSRDLATTPEIEMLWLRDVFIESRFDWGKRIIAGHTYHKEPIVRFNKIIIDTMHHGGGDLTAVLLDEHDPTWYNFVHV